MRGSCQQWQNPNPRWGRVRAGWLLNINILQRASRDPEVQIYIFWGCPCLHSRWIKSSKRGRLWTKELAYDTNTQPPTMQFWDSCPGTSTPAHISCQVTSVGYMIGLGKVSRWFHLKPLEVMTHILLFKVMWRVTWLIVDQRPSQRTTTTRV